MKRRAVCFLIATMILILSPPAATPSQQWERVGDAAWAEAKSIEGFEEILGNMLDAFEEHAVIRLPMESCLEEDELGQILDRIYYRRDLVAASLSRMEATIRFASGVNTVEFLFTWIETRRQREEVQQKVPDILSSILHPGMTERQKLEAIHDHVVSTVNYDDAMLGRGAWEAMRGRAVCQGYALLTGALLAGAGFENRIVLSDDHAWNLVLTGGAWRHIDTAFDDPIIIGGGKPSGISREAFLKTDARMSALGHRWDEARYPAAR
ncbi:MAG: hypothetical protein Q7I97_03275 [Thermovirgaceae bacterium]|nr:hypothetical protein [Thermovirgaceae bacterium]